MKIEEVENNGDIRFVDDERRKGTLSSSAHKQRYLWVCKFVKGFTVLDAGCGSGYGSYYVATHSAKSVLGIDKSQIAIKYARSRYQAPNLRFEQIDLTLPFSLGEKFDAAVSFDVIEHIWNYPAYLENICRTIKSKGMLVIGTPNKAQRLTYHNRWESHHPQEFTSEELTDVLSKHFESISLYGQYICEHKKKLFVINANQGIKKRNFRDFLRPFFPKFVKENRLLRKIAKVPPLEVVTLTPDDIEVTDGEVDKAFGLIAICQRLKSKE